MRKIATIIVIMFVLISAWPSVPAFGQEGEFILLRGGEKFARGENDELYLLDLSSGVFLNLTNDEAQDIDPSISPDGVTAVFASLRDGEFDLFVMGLDGSNLTKLTVDIAGDATSPVWSPDGAKIAFNLGYEGIHIINADGTGLIALTKGEEGLTKMPTWSSDGTKMAFAYNDSQNVTNIYVMDADGSNWVNLTGNEDSTVYYSGPAWSPVGDKIAFQSNATGNNDIYVINADGSGLTNLTDSPEAEGSASWSMDGTKVVYIAAEAGKNVIYAVDPAGGTPTRLGESPYMVSTLARPFSLFETPLEVELPEIGPREPTEGDVTGGEESPWLEALDKLDSYRYRVSITSEGALAEEMGAMGNFSLEGAYTRDPEAAHVVMAVPEDAIDVEDTPCGKARCEYIVVGDQGWLYDAEADTWVSDPTAPMAAGFISPALFLEMFLEAWPTDLAPEKEHEDLNGVDTSYYRWTLTPEELEEMGLDEEGETTQVAIELWIATDLNYPARTLMTVSVTDDQGSEGKATVPVDIFDVNTDITIEPPEGAQGTPP